MVMINVCFVLHFLYSVNFSLDPPATSQLVPTVHRVDR